MRGDILSPMAAPRPIDTDVRSADRADYEHYVRLVAQLALPADEPIPPATRWETEWMPATFLVTHRDETVGYGVVRALGDTGHVVHVVTDRAWRGRGVGRAILREAAERLRASGCTRWALNVRPDNAPAIALYERMGMRVAHRSTSLALAWADVARLPRDPIATAARTIEPEHDPELEASFELPSGRLAALRARALVLLQLVAPDLPSPGIACFDPLFPGAMLFRVRRPALARALLDGMRDHARPEDASVSLFCEDDDALVDTLRRAGARTRAETLHMTGALP